MYYSSYLGLILLLFCCIDSLGDLSLFLQNILNTSTGPITVLPVNALGLANRLRIISSAYSIASSNNASLVVIWGANEDCDISFEELFTSSTIRVYSVAGTIDGFDRYVRRSINEIIHKTQVSVQEIFPREFKLNKDWTSTRISILWTRGTHADINTFCGEYLHHKRQFYKQLQPTKHIQNMIDRMLPALYNGGMVVGVHIRAFDERYDWAVVSPSWTATSSHTTSTTMLEGETTIYQLQSKRFDEAASLNSFITIITQLLAVHPNLRFFIASNSLLAKNNIIQYYGRDRIITLDETGNTGQRDTRDSILAAVAEFWLLGESAFVIHTRGSSFAREAASRSNLPVLDASVEFSGVRVAPGNMAQPVKTMVSLYFFSVWEVLPNCGMPEFIRAAYTEETEQRTESRKSSQVSADIITETTKDSAEVVDERVEYSSGREETERDRERSRRASATTNTTTTTDSGGTKVCYQEDDRVICTIAYTVCPCSPREGYSTGFSHLLGLHIGHLLHCYKENLVPERFFTVDRQQQQEEEKETRCVSILAESNGYSL